MSAEQTVSVLLAKAPPPPADPGGQGEDFGKSSPLGLVLLILFGVAVALLIRSMTKHLKKAEANLGPAHAAGPAREVPDEDGDAEASPESTDDPQGKDQGDREGGARPDASS